VISERLHSDLHHNYMGVVITKAAIAPHYGPEPSRTKSHPSPKLHSRLRAERLKTE
jgi:hypothetical protein